MSKTTALLAWAADIGVSLSACESRMRIAQLEDRLSVAEANAENARQKAASVGRDLSTLEERLRAER